MKTQPKDKVVFGHVLKPSIRFSRIWMTDDNSPFILLSYLKSKKLWTIIVEFDGIRFEADGPSEKKALANFLANVEKTQRVITNIKDWAGEARKP
jgi:hypothetical protein